MGPRIMKTATLPVPEIGLIAATRGMAGAGVALLLASRLDESKRKKIGWPLLAIGVLSTVPFVIHLFKSMKDSDSQSAAPKLRDTNFNAANLP